MALVGYGGQDELGGHTFFQQDGSSLYVPDMPEARRIAASLQPQPDMQLAQNAPMGPDTRIDAPPQAPPSVADVPQASGTVDPGPSAMRSGLVRAGQDIVNPPKLPSLQQTAGVAPAASTSGGLLTPQEEALGTRVPTGGAVSLEQSQKKLQKKAGMGVVMPQTYGVETTGAIPENPELEAAWTKAKMHEFEAQRKIAESDLSVADATQKRAQAAATIYENEWQKAMLHQRHVEWEAQQKIDAVKQFDQDAQARYKDFGPDRFFKQRGTWATIGAAVMQGLGAYAAITGHTQNFAMEIIQRAQDADVQAQRDEYMRDKDARNNLVAEIARATGDVDVATEAAKAIQLNLAATHANEMAALAKKSEVAKNWELLKPQFEQGVVDHMQKAYEKGLGNTVLKTTAQYKYPQASGGMTELQQLEYKEKVETKKTNIAKQRAERGDLSPSGPGRMGPNDIAPGVRAAGGKEEAMAARKELADLDAADKELETLEKATEGHEWASKIGNKKYPGTPYPISDTGTDIEAKRSAATGAVGVLSNSGVVNGNEYPRIVGNLDTVAGIRANRQMLKAKRDAIIRGKARIAPPQPTEKK